MGGVAHIRVHRANLKRLSTSFKWTTVHHPVHGKREAKGLNVTTKVYFLNAASDELHTNPALFCPTTNKEFLRVCSNIIFLLLFLGETTLPSQTVTGSTLSASTSLLLFCRWFVHRKQASRCMYINVPVGGTKRSIFYTLLCDFRATQIFYPYSGPLYVHVHLLTQSKVHYDGVKMNFASVCSFTQCK